ncbi:arylsulfatase [Roseomonas sp. M0104]|uniref:Arylsulfatase n=1 Tax=Teichococcus coralli TaxID=2545983 RepID=A0A845BE63_9PROT|nr:arylsulfatase [Pseudoroseomonas coralli]MXP63572.1 arylsulfatase [Pseudoroseomonas coralli]
MSENPNRRAMLLGSAATLAAPMVAGARFAQAQQQPAQQQSAQQQGTQQAAGDKPNIIVIWGDDIGFWNLSYNNRGMMGYRTPNIDRIFNEGMAFTDYYAEQSCTAGRSAFITGQTPVRTGLSKVGLPGAAAGMQAEDPTIATILKGMGYSTGQFGKNHLGDRDEHLPTNHGFDEFFGNLYHLNAEEEPENEDYPKNPEFRRRFGPRGVIKSFADGRIENTGPLTKKRMETIDSEFLTAALDFMDRKHSANQPMFVWFNTTRMHFRTHVPSDYRGRSGLDEYADGMLQHDDQVGQMLKKIEDLGIADNTIVVYGTDNGPHFNTWPDAGITPFRSEKNSNWEGAYRVPFAVRWPGHIKPGSVTNQIVSNLDWFPTLVAAAGDDGIKQKLLDGFNAGGRTYKVHLDGYNQLPLLTGQTEDGPRKEFFYFNDDGQMVAMRYERWKVVFLENRGVGFGVWREPFIELRVPKLFDLRMDPFERADDSSNTYNDWLLSRVYLLVPAQAMARQFYESFREFPPRQKPDSFNLEGVLRQLEQGAAGGG